MSVEVQTKISGSEFMQFGKKVIATQMQFKMLEAYFEVDHEVQRKIDPRRRVEIRQFILDSLENGNPFYFSPFVFSARDGIEVVDDGFIFKPGCKIYILDGQHRSKAISSAINHLTSLKEEMEDIGSYNQAEEIRKRIDLLKKYPVSMQIYLDLDQREERQLFTDLNTERREAHIGLVMQYDQRDPYTELVRQIADQLIDEMEIDHTRSRLTNRNTAITSLVIMRKCLLALFEGVLTVKKGNLYPRVNPKKVPEIAKLFFLSWKKLFPKRMADREKYVPGLSGIQIALAYTVFLLMRQNSISYQVAIQRLLTLRNHCSWEHHDPLFSHMYNPETGKITHHSSTTAIQKTAQNFFLKINNERD